MSEAREVTQAFQAANWVHQREVRRDCTEALWLLTTSSPRQEMIWKDWGQWQTPDHFLSPGWGRVRAATNGFVSLGGRGVAATREMVRAALLQCGTCAAGGPRGGAWRAAASGPRLLFVRHLRHSLHHDSTQPHTSAAAPRGW